MNGTYRCNQAICDFANQLWPGMDEMTSLTKDKTEHAGVFRVAKDAVEEYVQRFNPKILRYNKTTPTFGFEAINFGIAKGLEFKRVLIMTNRPIEKYLKTGELKYIEKSKNKFHVAITRAKHSVCFRVRRRVTNYSGMFPLKSYPNGDCG